MPDPIEILYPEIEECHSIEEISLCLCLTCKEFVSNEPPSKPACLAKTCHQNLTEYHGQRFYFKECKEPVTQCSAYSYYKKNNS